MQKDAGADKRIIQLSGTLNESLVSLRDHHTAAVQGLTESFERARDGMVKARVTEIVEALGKDDTETGKAMRDLLVSLRNTGSLQTRNPFEVPGLMTLEDAKLVDRYVAPTSLWAGVDSYETDPAKYVLTHLGKMVAERLAQTTLARGEAEGVDAKK